MADRGARRSRQRSFAGFAEVDTTEADHTAEAGALPAVEPALVLTFFATGLGPEPTDGHWSGDPLAPVVPDLHAAQRGRVVRAESYVVGRHGPQAQPFAINATGCVGRVLQATLPAPSTQEINPLADRAVLAILESETLTIDLAGPADDPRIGQSFALAHDDWGTATLAASVAYPRRAGKPLADPAQGQMSVVLNRHGRAHVDRADRLSLNLDLWPEEYAVPGLTPPARGWFTRSDAQAMAAQALAQPVADDAAPVPGRAQQLSASASVYWRSDFSDALPAAVLPEGEIGTADLSHPPCLHHTEAAAFSEAFARTHFGAAIPARLPHLGYVAQGAPWWRGTPVLRWWGADRFFLARGHQLANGAMIELRADPSRLFTAESVDAHGARQTAEIDEQTAAIRRQVSPNGA